MEEDKKKAKEYYQVNLDTGRIFWIVCVVGIVVIGIFFLGLFFGGGKEEKDIFSFDRSEMFKREYVEEKDLIEAFFREVPPAFRDMMRRLFQKLHVDYQKYVNDADA